MNKTKSNFKYYFSFLPIVLIFLDQISKYFVRKNLSGGKDITLIPKVLSFHYLENRGAVWGFFQGKYQILSILSIIIMLVFLYFMIKMPATKRYLILYLVCIFIVSGAVGNLIDRVGFGFVTDFIYFEIINFPIFNVADIYVTCAMFVLAFLILFYYKDEELEFLTIRKSEKKEDES